MWIAVDFDHTLVNGDKPVLGAKEAMQRLKDAGHKILIHSCNEVEWIRKVLRSAEIHYDGIHGESELDIHKPACGAYLDDRGVGFTGDWDVAINEIQNIEKRRRTIPGFSERIQL